ncbi:MAG: RasGEF domain-containing protein [archaeon]|nr:RasGEF domain-containing protein [archaeon]
MSSSTDDSDTVRQPYSQGISPSTPTTIQAHTDLLIEPLPSADALEVCAEPSTAGPVSDRVVTSPSLGLRSPALLSHFTSIQEIGKLLDFRTPRRTAESSPPNAIAGFIDPLAFSGDVAALAEGVLLLRLIENGRASAQTVREVLVHDLTVLDRSDDDGRTALHHAVSNDSIAVVAELLRFGARCDASDNRGWTPLHYVLSQAMLLLLLDKSDPNARTKSGTSAFCHILLLKEISKEILNIIQKKGPDILGQNNRGEQPLHYAARNPAEVATLWLIENGVDVNCASASGDTPLHHSIQNKNSATALCLLSSGADIAIKNKRGRSPLDIAKDLGLWEVVNAPQNLLKLYSNAQPILLSELLASLLTADESFLRVFFLTYYTCTTTADLFCFLLSQFYRDLPGYRQILPPEQFAQQRQVIGLLNYWATTAFLDTMFEETDATSFDDLFLGLTWFCKWTSEEHSICQEPIAELSQLLQRIEMKRMFIPTPTALVESIDPFFDLFQQSEFHLARCITLSQHSILAAIPPHEFLGQKWSGPKKSQAPNLVNYIEHWNSLCRWVSLTILRPVKLKARQAALVKWIKIAYLCHQWRNFSSLNAIVSSLSGQAIYRLRKTFTGVPSSHLTVLDAFKNLVTSGQNFSNYRKVIASCSFPCIPYLGVILKDLTFIEDGNPDVFDDGKINFSKNIRIYSALLQIFSSQKFSYQFKITPRTGPEPNRHSVYTVSRSKGRLKSYSKLDTKSQSSRDRAPTSLNSSWGVATEADLNFPSLDLSDFSGDICELLPTLPRFELLPTEARVFLNLPKTSDDELFALSLEREKREPQK